MKLEVKVMMNIGKLSAILALALTVGSATAPAQALQKPLNVVSSFSVIGELVQKVGGDQVENHVIVGPDSDSHTFEPTPQDGVALRNADLVVQNGLGFEPWLDRLYSASRSRGARLSVSETLGTLRMVGEEDAEEVDPHVWHDVQNVMQMVETIRDVLILTDVANASTYQANAAAYLMELRGIDTWVVQQTSQIPPAQRKLVTSHDTFGYFAQRYGFEIVGTALGSISTEVADPSAGEITELISDIKAARVPAIFAENVSNRRLIDQIATAAGVKLVPDLYTDAIGEAGTPGDSYVGMMRHNVTRIVEALSGT
ncbi:MAG: metal ABC transporter solute-binding protein, Zn/Mn family [Chloroflexota bacterium]